MVDGVDDGLWLFRWEGEHYRERSTTETGGEPVVVRDGGGEMILKNFYFVSILEERNLNFFPLSVRIHKSQL